MYVLVTLACYLAFCLVGLLMVLPVDYGGGEASIGLTGQILGACILVVFAGPLIRTPFLRVVLSDEGIVVHNPVRTRRYTWGQIARCEVGEIGGNLVPLVAPILTLADSDESFGIRFLESFWLFRKPEQTRAGRLAATIEARRLSAIG
ncbi:PH domain-containing protein [Cryptosporangium arvum]|nr:PH domain-containing protein [Cryptosporangium arvum]